jgi:hypothetical protein
LEHVFRIRGAAGYTVSRAKNTIVVRSEEHFELPRWIWNWSQGSYGCLHNALLKVVCHSVNDHEGALLTANLQIYWVP